MRIMKRVIELRLGGIGSANNTIYMLVLLPESGNIDALFRFRRL